MRYAALLAVLAGCPDDGNPKELWLAGDPTNELVTYLQDTEPAPY
jgi:hypothetical protein